MVSKMHPILAHPLYSLKSAAVTSVPHSEPTTGEGEKRDVMREASWPQEHMYDGR